MGPCRRNDLPCKKIIVRRDFFKKKNAASLVLEVFYKLSWRGTGVEERQKESGQPLAESHSALCSLSARGRGSYLQYTHCHVPDPRQGFFHMLTNLIIPTTLTVTPTM